MRRSSVVGIIVFSCLLLLRQYMSYQRYLIRKEAQKNMFNMGQLAQVALSAISESHAHHAHVTIEPLPKVMVDKSLLGHVFTNLLSNANKYSSKREKPIVTISCVEHPDEVTFCVRDNGVGFDMKYVSKLFGVFQRLHSDSEFEGTGVGLAIAYRIIQKHGGKMWAEAQEGEGAAFYFSLPVNQSGIETKQTEETVKYTNENTRFLGEEKLNSVERKKIENSIVGILLIEDNAHDAEMTIRALKKNRITNGVFHLKDGVQALDFLLGTGEFAVREISQKPKVILLDLKMPKVDGIEVLVQIKSNEVTKNIPVVVLTSSKENPDIEKCYALGANSCIVKPVDFAGFMQAISHSRLYWVMLNHPPV